MWYSGGGNGKITPMARIHEIVFDCRHPASIARFWAAALGDYEIAPYDEAELQRLRNLIWPSIPSFT